MSGKKIYTEEELVALLRDKNTDAFNSLYDHYAPALYGIILRIVNDNDIAEDILQDSFLKIWNHFSNYDASKGRLFTWMLNIARNAAIDYLRSSQAKVSTQNQSLDNSVYEIETMMGNTTYVDHIGLKSVLKKLRPEYILLIDMVYYKGYTQDEIARELNIPLGTVKTRIRAALNQLREILKTK